MCVDPKHFLQILNVYALLFLDLHPLADALSRRSELPSTYCLVMICFPRERRGQSTCAGRGLSRLGLEAGFRMKPNC